MENLNINQIRKDMEEAKEKLVASATATRKAIEKLDAMNRESGELLSRFQL